MHTPAGATAPTRFDPSVAPWLQPTPMFCAKAWARRGQRVFPIQLIKEPDGKTRKVPCMHRPLPGEEPGAFGDLADWQDSSKGGFHQAVNNEAGVQSMWRLYPHAWIGYALAPGQIVIDVDSHLALAPYPELEASLDAADTFIVNTARGRHYYFNIPASCNVELRQDVGYPVKDVDTRLCGRGLCVLPGVDPYHYERGDPNALADLPDVWIAAFAAVEDHKSKPAPASSGPRKKVSYKPSTFTSPDEPGPIPDGERNGRLLKVLGRFRRHCQTFEELYAYAIGTNIRLCDPPMSDDEVLEVAQSSWSYKKTDPAPEPKPAPAPEDSDLRNDETGWQTASVKAGYPLARLDLRGYKDPIVQCDGDWQELHRGSALREIVCNAIGKLRDAEGNRLRIRRTTDEWRTIVCAAALGPSLTVSKAFPMQVRDVTNWANCTNDGGWTFGSIATRVGLIDKHVGSSRGLTPVVRAIIRHGLAEGESDWVYGDVRIDKRRHSDLWHIKGRIPKRCTTD